jgi:hypothetical protein
MQFLVGKIYRLKEGAGPILGITGYKTNFLELLGFDTDDMSVLVKPLGLSEKTRFWARAKDVEEQLNKLF